jgi:hypothetical protein
VSKKEIEFLKDAYKPKLRKNYYSIEEFKSIFKVGDLICGWTTGKTIQITAIGHHRFLGIAGKDREEVNSITGNAWVKVEKE